MKSCWVSTSQKISVEATCSPSGSLLALEEERGVFEPCALRIGNRELAARVNAGPAVGPVLRDSVEVQVEPRPAVVAEQPALGHRHDALERSATRLLRRQATAHSLYSKERSANFYVRFPTTGRARRANAVIAVLPRPNDR